MAYLVHSTPPTTQFVEVHECRLNVYAPASVLSPCFVKTTSIKTYRKLYVAVDGRTFVSD
jgi:hypothetical protein